MRRLLSALLIVVTVLVSAASAARPTLAQAAAEPGSLRAMLQQAPLVPLGGEDIGSLTYGNLALQAEVMGVSAPEDGQDASTVDPWLAAVGAMHIHSRASYMALPEWEELFGFSLFDLDQVVEYASPPNAYALFRGRFEADDLVRHWVAAGYQARDSETGPYYTIRDDFEIELSSDTGRLAMASANFVAVLAPDTIAFASSLTPSTSRPARAPPSRTRSTWPRCWQASRTISIQPTSFLGRSSWRWEIRWRC